MLTTVSITGASVHSHPVTDQLKWSHNEEYLFLKKRRSPLSPLRELWYTLTLLRISLKWSHNEEYLFLKKRCSPLSPLQELRYTLTLLRISWNEVTMKTTCIWRTDIHLRSFGTLSPHYGSAEMKLQWTVIFFEWDMCWSKTVFITWTLVQYNFTALWISWNKVVMKIIWFWRREVHHRYLCL